MPNQNSTDVGLDPHDLDAERETAWERFSSALKDFCELEAAGRVIVAFDANDGGKGRHVPAWDVLSAAYTHLRDTWVPSPGRRRIRSKKHPSGNPHSRARILAWCDGIADFRTAFYGPETPSEIKDVVLLYRRKWDKWHKVGDRYRAQQSKYQKGYMAGWRARRKAMLEGRS